jgi:hypothetical protein
LGLLKGLVLLDCCDTLPRSTDEEEEGKIGVIQEISANYPEEDEARNN